MRLQSTSTHAQRVHCDLDGANTAQRRRRKDQPQELSKNNTYIKYMAQLWRTYWSSESHPTWDVLVWSVVSQRREDENCHITTVHQCHRAAWHVINWSYRYCCGHRQHSEVPLSSEDGVGWSSTTAAGRQKQARQATRNPRRNDGLTNQYRVCRLQTNRNVACNSSRVDYKR